MSFFYDAERIVRRYQHKIVLPEGNDIRVIGAAANSKRKRDRYGKSTNYRS